MSVLQIIVGVALAAACAFGLPAGAHSQGYNPGQPEQPAAQPPQPGQPGQPGQPQQPGQAREKEEYPGVSKSGVPVMEQWLQQQERQRRLKQSLYGLDPTLDDRPASRVYR